MLRGRRAPGEPCQDEVECRFEVGDDAYCDFRPGAPEGVCAVTTYSRAEQGDLCGGTCRDDTASAPAFVPMCHVPRVTSLTTAPCRCA